MAETVEGKHGEYICEDAAVMKAADIRRCSKITVYILDNRFVCIRHLKAGPAITRITKEQYNVIKNEHKISRVKVTKNK